MIDITKFSHGEKINHYETNTNETLKEFNEIFTADSITLDVPDDTMVTIGDIINDGDNIMRNISVGDREFVHHFSKIRGEKSYIQKPKYEVYCSTSGDLLQVFERQKDCASYIGTSVPTLTKYEREGLVFADKYLIKKVEGKKIFRKYKERDAKTKKGCKDVIYYSISGHIMKQFDDIFGVANYLERSVEGIRVHICKKKKFKDKTYVRYA